MRGFYIIYYYFAGTGSHFYYFHCLFRKTNAIVRLGINVNNKYKKKYFFIFRQVNTCYWIKDLYVGVNKESTRRKDKNKKRVFINFFYKCRLRFIKKFIVTFICVRCSMIKYWRNLYSINIIDFYCCHNYWGIIKITINWLSNSLTSISLYQSITKYIKMYVQQISCSVWIIQNKIDYY